MELIKVVEIKLEKGTRLSVREFKINLVTAIRMTIFNETWLNDELFELLHDIGKRDMRSLAINLEAIVDDFDEDDHIDIHEWLHSHILDCLYETGLTINDTKTSRAADIIHSEINFLMEYFG